MRILVVEDDRDLAANLLDYLELQQCTVDYAASGKQALSLSEHSRFDAIVLDIGIPDVNGLQVCRQLRERQLRTPIIFLTARDSTDDKVAGFDAGADDYLVKPFAMRELHARLLSLSKRRLREQSNTLQVAGLTLDLDSGAVMRDGQCIKLNPSCTKLLLCLMRHSPNIVSREQLCEALWGEDVPDTDVLRSHLYLLREALDKPFADKRLHTVHGVGFYLGEAKA
ncbi:MAG: response regulator transcription factor [Pseudomonadales bacterium]